MFVLTLSKILKKALCVFGAAVYVLMVLSVLLADVNTAEALKNSNFGGAAREKLKGQTLYNLQEVVSRQLMPYISREADEIVFIYDEWPTDKAYLRGVGMTAEEAEYLNGVPHDRRVVVLASDEKKPSEDTP